MSRNERFGQQLDEEYRAHKVSMQKQTPPLYEDPRTVVNMQGLRLEREIRLNPKILGAHLKALKF